MQRTRDALAHAGFCCSMARCSLHRTSFELEHDVLELDRFVPQARGTNDLVSRTRHSVPSAVQGRASTKNRENNPMQSRMDPGSQHSCCAASGAEERPQPNLIPL